MNDDPIRAQFLRYTIVGLVSNGVLYAAYLALTSIGAAPRLAMTVLYVAGVVQTFFFNKSWSFRFGGLRARTFARYCVAYALGYVANFLALLFLVDRLGYPHQIVQAIMIVLLALMLFTLQKYWVFRKPSSMPSATDAQH